MNTVNLKPVAGSILRWLEKHGSAIEDGDIANLTWAEIHEEKMPIAFVQSPTDNFAYVLYNREVFDTYKRQALSDSLKRTFYLAPIDDIVRASELLKLKHAIEPDRKYAKMKERQYIPPNIKDEVRMMIALEYGKTKTARQIAEHFGIAMNYVNYLIDQLAKDVPTVKRVGKKNDHAVFLANLKITHPELFGGRPDVPAKKLLGRPRRGA